VRSFFFIFNQKEKALNASLNLVLFYDLKCD
jgi:hypothetical protein